VVISGSAQDSIKYNKDAQTFYQTTSKGCSTLRTAMMDEEEDAASCLPLFVSAATTVPDAERLPIAHPTSSVTLKSCAGV